ncbi:lysylphosphatidylglycerol synthase transmembrane domain-containing protein [Bacillus sp. FJAT-47783]|uniref:lysylphosphatidylglycerol synthase transmembrane domain-containing protein n=1 Tax=Bacillus sp. FJAT-47783 TaxID=2922712 RepID=UPI001FAE47B8|nr:lysylphosphatidylglycerol synthase transmembrane domain-containing protein [Bacillus sp. FJAT-47783]
MFSTNNLKRIIGFTLFFLCIWLIVNYFDLQSFINLSRFIVDHPTLLTGMFFLYLTAFLLRAYAWFLYIGKRVSYKVCVSGVFYSMFVNHLLPFKGGDLVRIGIGTLHSPQNMKADEIIHSVVMMRIVDVCILAIFSAFGLYVWIHEVIISIRWLYVLGICGLLTFFLFFTFKTKLKGFVMRHLTIMKNGLRGMKGVVILFSIIFSWILEGFVLYFILLGEPTSITITEAVWVNSLTVGGQFFQVTPGGIATYEAMMTFSLNIVHVPYTTAFSAAILTHLFKFIFSFFVGFIAYLLVPIKREKITEFLRSKKHGYNLK